MNVRLCLDTRKPARCEHPRAEHYGAMLDQLAWAEQTGAISVRLTEHHFFEDGYLPQPLTLTAGWSLGEFDACGSKELVAVVRVNGPDLLITSWSAHIQIVSPHTRGKQ